MKINHIIQYEAEDGKTFKTQSECERYSEILKEVNEYLLSIPNPDKYNITNGDGYILHNPRIHTQMEKLIVKLSNKWFKHKEPFTNFNYVLGRYIDDSNMICLNRLSYRLMCIRDDREYGQPYFANNPDKCKDIQVN